MKISKVECTSVEKRSKQQVYVLEVNCSNGEKYLIYRTYQTFFDFKAKLKDKAKDKDVTVPEIGLKWFEKVGKASEKKKRQINEFCKAVLQLPSEIIENDDFEQFFEIWPIDSDQSNKEEKSPKKLEKTDKKRDKKNRSSSDQSGEFNFVDELKGKQKHKSATGSESKETKIADNPLKDTKVKSEPLPVINGEQTTKNRSSNSNIVHRKLSSTGSSDSQEEQYIAVEDFHKDIDTEVELQQGDTVLVLSKELTGWWFVHKEETGEEGYAPGAKLIPVNSNTEEEALDEIDEQDHYAVYEAISDFTAKTNDEVTYKKNEKVEVIKMRTDGWWKVRNSIGVIGLAPAVNLARVSDGSGPPDPLYSDISLYSQTSVFKKKTPPKRNPSQISLSELYAKVQRLPNYQPPKSKLIDNDDDDDYDYMDTTMYAGKPKPNVPPRPVNLQDPLPENYSEIEFIDGDSKKFEVRRSTDSVLYSDVNPSSLPPKAEKEDDPGQHLYLNVRRAVRHSYENSSDVVNDPELKKQLAAKPQEIKYYELIQDYNPVMTHQEGMPACKGDIVKVSKEKPPLKFCLMCLKERIEMKPCEGWIPEKCLSLVTVDVIDTDQHNVPVVRVIPKETKTPTSETQNAPGHYADVVQGSTSPVKSRAMWGRRSDKKGEWFIGQMSRSDCEELLKNAKNLEFVIRESKHGSEEYSISVKYHDAVKHFRVEKQGEGKYQIGGYVFRNLPAIVKHYKKQALFYGEDKQAEMLGKPFVMKRK